MNRRHPRTVDGALSPHAPGSAVRRRTAVRCGTRSSGQSMTSFSNIAEKSVPSPSWSITRRPADVTATDPRSTKNSEPLVAGEETGAANCDQQRRGGGSSLAQGCPPPGGSNSSHPDRSVISPSASGRKRSILRRALSPSLMVVFRPSRIPGREAGAGPALVTPGTPAPDAQASVGPR